MHLGPEQKIVEEESNEVSMGCINITANASNLLGSNYLLEDELHSNTLFTNFAEYSKNIHESGPVPLQLLEDLDKGSSYKASVKNIETEADQPPQIMAHSPTPPQELMPDFHDQLVELNKRGMECLSQGNFKES